jgi:mevalonate kinase
MMTELLHAKILLFGEYSVLVGSQALTTPFHHFGGRFNYLSQAGDHRLAVASNQFLKYYLQFLRNDTVLNKLIDITRFEEHLGYGLYFDSDIPLGYGLGSSGAVVAGIFKNYGVESVKNELMKPENRMLLKVKLAEMESFYHGKSSGIDPLSILLNTPLKIGHDEISAIPQTAGNIGAAVYDLGFKAKTQYLVNEFMTNYQNDSNYKNQIDEYCNMVNQCIEILTTDHSDAFFEYMKNISLCQLRLFDKMLPPDAQKIVEEGLESGVYFAKLCGSGGGGYLLFFYNKSKKPFDYLTAAIEVL